MDSKGAEFRKEYLTGFCHIDVIQGILMYEGRIMGDGTSRYAGTYFNQKETAHGKFVLENCPDNSLTLDCIIRKMAKRTSQKFKIRERRTLQSRGIGITDGQLSLLDNLINPGEAHVPIS